MPENKTITPPGVILLEELKKRKWTQIEFAQLLECQPAKINEIIKGKLRITAKTAKQFAAALTGTTAEFWMRAQTAYDLSVLELKQPKDNSKVFKTLNEVKEEYFPNRSIEELEGRAGDSPEVFPVRKDAPRKFGVGMPATILLNQFGKVVNDAFGQYPYMVGSATQHKQWRDVDVRLILSDEEFDKMFNDGRDNHSILQNPKWQALCLAFSLLGKQMTGLPIDFQIDRQTDANEKHQGERHSLILCDPVFSRPHSTEET